MASQVRGFVHMFRIKTLSEDDYDFAVRITDQMDWNLSNADFEFMVELEPEGCFVLFEESRRIGLAATVNYGSLGWFGNLVVDERYRNKGAGSLLVKHSIEYLASRKVKTIGLYAYMDRIHFYQALGFKYDSEFTVLKGKGRALQLSSAVRQAEKQDLQEIMELDRSCFGGDRRKLIEPIILDPDNSCYVYFERRHIAGYEATKMFGKMAEIGPLVCRKGHDEAAISLLNSTLSGLKDYEVLTYVPNIESVILNHLKTLGFTESFRVARMVLGSLPTENCIYIAESLERG